MDRPRHPIVIRPWKVEKLKKTSGTGGNKARLHKGPRRKGTFKGPEKSR